MIRKRRDGLQVQVYAGRDPLSGRKRYVSQQVPGQTKASIRQAKQIERFAKMEERLIPPGVDFAAVTGLRNEAKLKLTEFGPRSLGQALRISGITPADVTLLAVHLDRRQKANG